MAARPALHAYFVDGDRKALEPIHALWYTAKGVLELNERLRAPPVDLRFRSIGRDLGPAERARLTPEILRLTRQVMDALVRKTQTHVESHMARYPLPEFDADLFRSPIGRSASERYLGILRDHDRALRPKSLTLATAVPPIVVMGTNRSAESLRMHALFGGSIAWNQLENQRGTAHADYCLDIAAIGSETALNLLDYWWEGKDATAERGLPEAYDTLFHEVLHRVCDLTNAFGPQYGPKGSAKEHYWMEEYEPFATEVEDVLITHLAEGGERGLLRRRVEGETRG